jgi:site-specific DNA recombinase
VIYVRQSMDRTGDEQAVSRQREDCQKLAQRRELNVVEVVVDNDVSASGRKPRPGFDLVIEMLAARRVQAVIAWDMTRLTRNHRDTLRLLEVGQAAGATLLFVRGSDLNLGSADGRTLAGILSSIAHGEIEKKAERQRRAAQQAAEAGRPVGGRRPFGYEPDKITIRPVEAEALRAAYDAVLAGVSLARVAAELNAKGLGTGQRSRKTGEPSWWTAQTLRPVLLSPRYAGLRAVTVRPEYGRPTWRVIGPAVWPAIVSEETWRATEELLNHPSRFTPGGARGLLTGVARCGVCAGGSTVRRGATSRQNGRSGHATYRCATTPGHLARSVEPVDEYLGEVVVERLSRPDASSLLIDTSRPDAAELRRRATALRSRLDGLAALFAEGALTAEGVRRESARLKKRLAEVEAQQADAGRVDVLGPLVDAENVRAVWEALGTDRQRAVIDTLMTVTLLAPGRGARTFRPESMIIEWKGQ